MVEFMLCALVVLMLSTFWPAPKTPVGGVSLAGAVFLAAPLGGMLVQTRLAGVGWLLLAFSLFVFVRWLICKWRLQ